jgi:hypothetical protein
MNTVILITGAEHPIPPSYPCEGGDLANLSHASEISSVSAANREAV